MAIDTQRENSATTYDYVIAVGPGRSGTTFLYRSLTSHPSFVAPHIKEAHYYRSERRLEQAYRAVRLKGATLIDIADTAWYDPRLDAVSSLVTKGWRILVVLTLRRHSDWARSMIGYRRSRVLPALPSLLKGIGGVERSVVRDSLAPEKLRRIFTLGADVLTIDFETLTSDPRAVVDTLAELCGADPFDRVDTAPVNTAQAARFPPFAALAKAIAAALRALGARRLLQWLKNRPQLVRFFFRPARPDEVPVLDTASVTQLDRRYADCLDVVKEASNLIQEGIWFARAAPAATDESIQGSAPSLP